MPWSPPMAGLLAARPAEPPVVEHRWDPHHVPSEEDLKATLAAQFPRVDSGGLRPLGSGWEFDAWETPDGWVFRFPRRREAPGQLRRERRFLDLVRPVLAPEVAVPEPVLWGEPGPRFPWLFAGYRKIAGRSADHPRLTPHPHLPRQMGRALARLHAIDPVDARAAGVAEDREGVAEWILEVREEAAGLRGLAPEVHEAVGWLRESEALTAPYDGPLRLVHNDLRPDHVLLDPETGSLRGILDWTDTALGDPTLDFVFLVTWGGWATAEAVLAAYEEVAAHKVDDAFRPRLDAMARTMSLHWLHEAKERGMGLEKHLGWVRNAFRTTPASDRR